MSKILLSDAEKIFIIHGVQQNVRSDGRSIEDFRFMELETDVLPHCCGSARIRLANTDVLVGIKAEIGEPELDRSNEGIIKFFVDCSANAAPQFEGRGGEDLNNSLTYMLSISYMDIGLEKLSIISKKKCWILYVDITILEVGGNLFDSTSLAVKCALFSTRIPNLTVSPNEYGETEIEVSDDPYDCFRLDVTNMPVIITLYKIGQSYVIDATNEEEICSNSKLILAVEKDGKVVSSKKEGTCSLHPTSVIDMIQIGARIGKVLNVKLMESLEKEELYASTSTKEQNFNISSILSGFMR